jgi:hypothetical protein
MVKMTTLTEPVLISASRGVGAIDDRRISRGEYVAVVKSSIGALKARMSRPASTAS